MARDKQTDSTDQNTQTGGEATSFSTDTASGAPTTNAAAAPATPAPAKDERFVTFDDPDHPGQTVKRKDFILRRWAEKKSRSEIAKELTKISGRDVPYQIVFAGTKGVAGGPDKTSANASAAAAVSGETAAAASGETAPASESGSAPASGEPAA